MDIEMEEYKICEVELLNKEDSYELELQINQ